MATKHTENYQLNLWELEDKFLRTEFNENFSGVDAALGALSTTVTEHSAKVAEHTANLASLNTEVSKGAWRVLKTLTAASAMSQWNINVSNIDFHQYFEVVLDYTQEATGATDSISLLLNGNTSGYGPFTGYSGGVHYTEKSILTMSRGDGGYCSVRACFLPHLYNDLIHVTGYYICGSSSSWWAGQINMLSSTTFSALNTINLVGTIPAGSTIKISAIK